MSKIVGKFRPNFASVWHHVKLCVVPSCSESIGRNLSESIGTTVSESIGSGMIKLMCYFTDL